MAPLSSKELLDRLDSLYTTWAKLRPDSSNEEFNSFGTYLAEDCVAWLSSMREWADPSVGRQAAIDFVKQNISIYYFEDRSVLSRSVSEDGRKATIEMKTRMNVMGKSLDNSYETGVATFNDQGLISDLKVYCCRSQVMLVVQGMTGMGPYSEGFQKEEWE